MFCQEWEGKIERVVAVVCSPRVREGGEEGAALVCVSSDEAFILEYSGVGRRREKAGGELFGEGEKTFYSLYPRN